MKPSAELIKLVDKCLNQSMTRPERARLEELLKDDHALHYYLEMTEIEVNIPFELSQPDQSAQPAGSMVHQKARPRWVVPLSMAAAIAISFSLGLICDQWLSQSTTPPLADLPSHSDHSDTSQPKLTNNAATITGLIDVDWDGQAPDSLKLKSTSQPIQMKSGLMELTFASGVRTLIEGPADIRVTGENHAHLTTGRMVADVPKGAEGFTVEYEGGKVVDLGTEFALYVPGNQAGVEVGVFRGEVEVYNDGQATPKKIIENHAVIHGAHSDVPFESIPFHRENYVRLMPTREFPWELPATLSIEPATMEFDVSHLVWASGSYRAVIKWMKGKDALVINEAELLLDGEVIASDIHQSRTGLRANTYKNTYTFSVPESQHRKGTWILRITGQADDRGHEKLGSFTPASSGLLLFEGHQAVNASDDAFVGTWRYRHDGDIHERTFTADHRALYTLNGEPRPIYRRATWRVEKGILILNLKAARRGHVDKQEFHLLRNERELIFINRPYRNAEKIEPDSSTSP